MKKYILTLLLLTSASAVAESMTQTSRVLLALAKPPAMHFSVTVSVIGSCNTTFMQKTSNNANNLTLEISAPQLGRVGCDNSVEVEEFEVNLPEWADMKKSFTVITEDPGMQLLLLQIKD